MFTAIKSAAAAKVFTESANKVVCDTVEPLAEPFDAARYMGTWYEIQRSSGAIFQPDIQNCTQAEYTDLDAATASFTVKNSFQVLPLPRAGLTGSATCAGTPNGQCIVSFFGQKFTEPNYLVMDTDYDTYAMVYACEPNDMAYLWILSRTPTLDQDILDSLNAQAAERLPNYDFSKAYQNTQGDRCTYNTYKSASQSYADLKNWFAN